ncbi:FG-GAP repeat domain-containing protein, partial [Candidatus Omnitrophota bacterium]
MSTKQRKTIWILAIASIVVLCLAQPVFATFTDVASSAGLSDTGDGDSGQVTWSDVNDDGYPDILFIGPNTNTRQVFLNDGDGTFTAGTGFAGGRAHRFGDFDNDGYRDLVYCANATYYNNDGNGWTVNGSDGLANANAQGYAWLDYNNDGWLDVIHPDGTTLDANLWENDTDGTFSEVTSAAGLPTSGLANGEYVMVCDYDNDGDVDIFYGQGQSGGDLDQWKNDGDDTFTVNADIVLDTLDNNAGFSMGDYDNDGDFDLIVAHINAVNQLLRTNADGSFTDVTSSSGDLNTVNLVSYGTAWGDFDHDGDLDLYVNNSGAADSYFSNDGDGTFTESASSVGITNSTATGFSGVATADYDLDGDLDIFVCNDSTTATVFYRNNQNDSNYLKVKVTGLGAGYSPKDATGSVVELYDSAGTTLRAIREISGGKSLGQDDPIVHFGLASGWGGGSGTYTVKVNFTGGSTVTMSGIVPDENMLVIGNAKHANTIEVFEGVTDTGNQSSSYTGTLTIPSGTTVVKAGNWYYDTVNIQAGGRLEVQGFGFIDSVSAGISSGDSKVTSPSDGWAGINANTITIAGTVVATGRGYGGGGGGGGYYNTDGESGYGGSNGAGGKGGDCNSTPTVQGSAGGGGSPAGMGGVGEEPVYGDGGWGNKSGGGGGAGYTNND